MNALTERAAACQVVVLLRAPDRPGAGGSMSGMATQPNRDPGQDELEAIYAANPGLRERLNEAERQLHRGELPTVGSTRIDQAIARIFPTNAEPD